MPYKSWKQAAYMHIHHPDIAKRWDDEYGTAPKKSDDSSDPAMKNLKKHVKDRHSKS